MTLEAREIFVRYGPVEALRGVSVVARRGVVTAVLGPNGAGKTTLLRALIGAMRPNGGTVLLDGDPIREIPRRRRAARVAYVAQRPLMSAGLSVREVVELGRFALEPAAARIDDALVRLDLVELADRAVTAMSTGQQQRVALARALAQVEPDGILVLDEPAAALDLGRVRTLVTLLRSVAAQGGGIVVTVHDVALASVLADEAWILDDGQVVANGRASEVLSPSVLSPIFGVGFTAVEGVGSSRVLIADLAPPPEVTAATEAGRRARIAADLKPSG